MHLVVELMLTVRMNPMTSLPALRVAANLSVIILLSACATQGPYRAPSPASNTPWFTDFEAVAEAAPTSPQWWTLLRDPAVDVLVDQAFENNPTLARALATLEETQANLGFAKASGLPSLGFDAALTRARGGLGEGIASTDYVSSGNAGITFGWEIDLFGRIRNSREAALRRLDARHADAQAARLTLAAETASTVIDLRSCRFSSAVQREDMVSRQNVLALTRTRTAAGIVAPAEVERAINSVEDSRSQEASTHQRCAEIAHSLAILTGQSVFSLYALTTPNPVGLDAPLPISGHTATRLVLPANVLAGNPAVKAAERELAAVWADIGVARAERLPRLDIAALLTGQWLRVAGGSTDATARSLGATLSVPLLDGGRGKANVDAAQARYRQAAASLELALREAWRDVENALAALGSAQIRHQSADESLRAARQLLAASDAQWRAGAISLFELEDSRRRYAQAQDSAIRAASDSSQAWIALIQASGNAAITSESNPNELNAISYN